MAGETLLVASKAIAVVYGGTVYVTSSIACFARYTSLPAGKEVLLFLLEKKYYGLVASNPPHRNGN